MNAEVNANTDDNPVAENTSNAENTANPRAQENATNEDSGQTAGERNKFHTLSQKAQQLQKKGLGFRQKLQNFQEKIRPYQSTINKVRIVLYAIAIPWAIFIAFKSMPYYAAIGRGESYFKQGLYEEAEKEFLFCYEQCKTENAKDPRMVRVLNNLGMIYRGTGRYRLAAPYVKETVEIAEKYFPKRQELPMSLSNEGALLNDLGQYAEAESVYKRAIETWKRNIRKDSDTKLAAIYNGLGRALREQGKLEEAVECAQKALSMRQKETGKDSPECAEVLENLAKIYQKQGRFAEAQEILEKAISIDRKAFGEKHPNVASDQCTMGRLLLEKGRAEESRGVSEDSKRDLEQSRRFLEQSLATRQMFFRPGHPTIARTLASLGELSSKQGDTDKAKDQLEKALAMQKKYLGAQHPDTLETANALKATLRALPRDNNARIH